MKTTILRLTKEDLHTDWNKLLSAVGKDFNKEIELREIYDALGMDETLVIMNLIDDKKEVMSFCSDVLATELDAFEKLRPFDNLLRELLKRVNAFVNGKIEKERMYSVDRHRDKDDGLAFSILGTIYDVRRADAVKTVRKVLAIYGMRNNEDEKRKEIENILLKHLNK